MKVAFNLQYSIPNPVLNQEKVNGNYRQPMGTQEIKVTAN